MVDWLTLIAAAGAGGAAGWAARVVLGRLRRPVRLPPGVPELAVCLPWTLLALFGATGRLPPWWLPVPAALVWLAVVLTASDLAGRRLPNALTLPAYPVTAALIGIAAAAGPGAGLATRAATAAVLLLVGHAVVYLVAPGQLGAGDVKLAGPAGAVLGAVGWPAVLLGPVVAAVVTVSLSLAARVRDGPDRGVPHGPGMLAGPLLLAVLAGPGWSAG